MRSSSFVAAAAAMGENLIRNFGTSSSFQCTRYYRFHESISIIIIIIIPHATSLAGSVRRAMICDWCAGPIFKRWNLFNISSQHFMVKRSESTLHSVPFKAVGGINFVLFSHWIPVLISWWRDGRAFTWLRILILILLFEKSVRWTVRIDFFVRCARRMKVQRWLCIYVMWNRNWMEIESSSKPVENLYVGSEKRNAGTEKIAALLSFIFLWEKKSRSSHKRKLWLTIVCIGDNWVGTWLFSLFISILMLILQSFSFTDWNMFLPNGTLR